METIHDIQFNDNLYSHFDSLVVILYQIEGVALAIPLSYIDLYTFIRPFREILACQDHIKTLDRKTFTLFTYSDNIETWLWNNHPITHNLDEIIIFCPFPNDIIYFNDWIRRYTKKAKVIVTYDELEREILIFGMRFINNLCLDFQGNQHTLQLLRQHHQQICLALINCLDQASNI